MGFPYHFVKRVQIRSYFWSVFSCIRTEYGDLLFSLNTGKYRPEITPYLDTFHEAPVHIKRHNVCRDIRYVSSVLTLLVIF